MGKKKARQKETGEINSEGQVESFVEEISEATWTIASLIIVAIGAALRCYRLGLKPFHHDEGVNGFFMMRLVREGVYTYDPGIYH